MISFKNDYAEGAHPRILEALMQSNEEQTDGYGMDSYCQSAVELIQSELGRDCFVTFLSGGTQANLTVISHALRQHQAVISASSGHIFTNEAGAIEATGHKVIACPSVDGKLTVDRIRTALADHDHVPHVVQPKLVYLSHPTELGTLYTKEELQSIRSLCLEQGLYLYIDGARLGCALAAQAGELTLADLADCADAFTAGGTKNGALFGEAVIIPNDTLSKDFLFSVKQKGGMLAKGRVLGIQFRELLRDGLYVSLGAHANRMAHILRDGLREAGCKFLLDSPTNQQFVLLPDSVVEQLSKDYGMLIWSKPDPDHSYVRLVTSWATKEENVQKFLQALKAQLPK